MNTRSQILCAWCGILCPIVFFVGLWPAAGFFPPHLPGASAAQIAAIYLQRPVGIRLGSIILLVAGTLYIPFTAAVAAQMRRMETRATPVLTYTQMGAGFAVVQFFMVPSLMWTIAAFRAERSPEITQVLNDMGWLMFVIPGALLGFLQNAALGLAILGDRKPVPVFPRWVGFFNLWLAVIDLPGVMATFFKSGLFAWNGLLAFWVPACLFGPWFYVVSWQVMRAAKRQAAEPSGMTPGE